MVAGCSPACLDHAEYLVWVVLDHANEILIGHILWDGHRDVLSRIPVEYGHQYSLPVLILSFEDMLATYTWKLPEKAPSPFVDRLICHEGQYEAMPGYDGGTNWLERTRSKRSRRVIGVHIWDIDYTDGSVVGQVAEGAGTFLLHLVASSSASEGRRHRTRY